MKPLLLLSLFLLTHNLAAASSKSELVERFVDSYRTLSLQRFGKDITLKLRPEINSLQATAGHLHDGSIEVTVYGGILREFDENELLFVLCHEMGHIFGEVTFADLPPERRGRTHALSNALEGEADYFAGSCISEALLNFLDVRGSEQEGLARKSIIGTMEKLYKSKIDHTLALESVYEGINPGYPDKECRVLTALQGLELGARPKCWYNP